MPAPLDQLIADPGFECIGEAGVRHPTTRACTASSGGERMRLPPGTRVR